MGIAQALLNEPRLLICDEPTSALDPVGRKEILDILRQVKGKTTVIFSTHILSDVERICDQIVVLNRGKSALSGMLAEIKARHRANMLTIEFASNFDKEKFAALAQIAPFMDSAEQKETGITLHAANIAESETAVLNALAKNGINPLRLEVAEPTIENLFLEVLQ